MFGRRRHVAAAAAPIVTVAETATPRPRLAEEQIFELVHTRIAAAIGEGGEWVVRRRSPDDTDDLFRSVLAHQVALDVSTALRTAQLQLEAGEPITVVTREGAVALRSASVAGLPTSDVPEAGASVSNASGAADDSLVDIAGMDDETHARPDAADVAVPTAAIDGDGSVNEPSDEDDADLGPAHRHDEPEGDEQAVLDEDAIALQWEPAPITVWTDLKKPVTGTIAMQLSSRELVTPNR
jgi:hypothetical protein